MFTLTDPFLVGDKTNAMGCGGEGLEAPLRAPFIHKEKGTRMCGGIRPCHFSALSLRCLRHKWGFLLTINLPFFFLWSSATHNWPSLLLYPGAIVLLVFNVFPVHWYQKKGKWGFVVKCLQTGVSNGPSWQVGVEPQALPAVFPSSTGFVLLSAWIHKALYFCLCCSVFCSPCLLTLP